MTDSVLEWFRSYLTDRYQHVMVNQASSPETRLACGVPQGSVLGPLLFSLFTSQLGPIIEQHGLSRKMFADDTEMYRSFAPDSASMREAVQAVEDCCSDVKNWMLTNRLKLNDDKTEAILCGSKSAHSKVSLDSIQVGSATIHLSDSVRNLGLYIDSHLTVSSHISSVVRSCYLFLRTLGQLRPMHKLQTQLLFLSFCRD